MMPNEKLIGLVWTDMLHHDTLYGYALLVTNQRVVGAKERTFRHACVQYIWGRYQKDADPDEVERYAPQVIRDKEFELGLDDIVRITYRKPGMFSPGHVTFKTAAQEIQLNTSSLWTHSQAGKIDRILQACLVVFAEEKFIDENSGQPMRAEFARKYHYDL